MWGGAGAAGVPLAGQWHQGRRSSEDTNPVSRNMDGSGLHDSSRTNQTLKLHLGAVSETSGLGSGDSGS